MSERIPEYPVDKIFLNRWSPRAMSGSITQKELFSLFEAGKWAPSCFNNQPWRFIYGIKDTVAWDSLFSLMGEFNQQWTKNAGALVLVISKKTFDHNGNLSATHSFDAGASWENIALQGSMEGLALHGMAGFDYEKAKKIAEVPDDYNVEMMFAVGKPGKKEDLPKEMQEREFPSQRKKLSEITFEGKFKKSN